jgi:flagellar basal-body rod protein FlgF
MPPMNVSLFQAASALTANSRWQEIIADNMASSSIPGYKRQQLSIAAVQAGLMPAGGVGGKNGPPTFVLPKATIATNFTAGEMKATGVSTDVAVNGSAFFQVQLPTGLTGYTRDGEFQVNAQGELTTKEGYPVLGESGGPIQLNPHDSAPMSISAGGEISQGATAKGKLGLAQFDNPSLLTQTSSGYFVNQNASLHTVPNTSTVRQGYVEGSNSSSVLEMANLMTAMRGFEANQHVIQIQDDRLGKTISDLGNPA